MKNILLFLSLLFVRQVNAQYVTIPDANFVTWLQAKVPSAMNGNQLDTTNTLVTTTIDSVSITYTSITNLTGIQYFKSLRVLLCDHNQLTFLPPLQKTLRWLDCWSNHITSLPTLPDSLQVLVTLSNPLHNLPILPNTLLRMDCGQDSLTSLPSLPNSLQVLICFFNQLTTLPTLPDSLKLLDCFQNKITCFPEFPNSIQDSGSFDIRNNLFTCLPNYINAMNTATHAYPLCATGNSNGCPVATGLKQLTNNANTIIVFPNPTSDQFYIEANTIDKLIVDLYDVNGRHVFGATVNDKETISTTTLDNGAYSLTIKTTDRLINKKLVIFR